MATQWLGSIPPPGVEPNFVDPPSQLHGNIALHTVCLTVVTAVVAMRLYTRSFIIRSSLGVDDCFCVFSYLLTIAFSALMIKSYTRGIGRHMWDTPSIWLPEALKYFTFAQYVYLVLTAVIKLTFLFFYYHIFSSQTVSKYFIAFGIVFVICASTTLFFANLFSCTPIARAWNSVIPGHCINPAILPYFSGALSSATDIYILVLPIPSLWGLNMRLGRKIKVLAVFGLGIFACVASLIRLGMTPVLQSSADTTWNISTIAIWAVVEANVGILCACLMLLPAFLDRHWPKAIGSFIGRLWSYTVSRQREKSSGTGDSSKQYQRSWPIQKRSDDNGSGQRAYFELNSSDNLHKAHHIV